MYHNRCYKKQTNKCHKDQKLGNGNVNTVYLSTTPQGKELVLKECIGSQMQGQNLQGRIPNFDTGAMSIDERGNREITDNEVQTIIDIYTKGNRPGYQIRQGFGVRQIIKEGKLIASRFMTENRRIEIYNQSDSNIKKVIYDNGFTLTVETQSDKTQQIYTPGTETYTLPDKTEIKIEYLQYKLQQNQQEEYKIH